LLIVKSLPKTQLNDSKEERDIPGAEKPSASLMNVKIFSNEVAVLKGSRVKTNSSQYIAARGLLLLLAYN
jgi:hypothetical protein